MRYVSMAAAALLGVIACGGSDDDGGGGPVLDGEAAVQAAVHGVVSLAAALDALLEDPSSAVATASAATGEPRRLARAIEVPCALGGEVDGECREEGGRTVVETRSRDCTIFAAELGVAVTTNGVSNATFDATGICGSPEVPSDVDSRVELRDYREEWRDGTEVVRVLEASRLDQLRRPVSSGCSANDGETLLDGDLRLVGAGFEWSLRMHDLRIVVVSAGSPCDQSALFEGGLEVDDGVRAARFAATLESLAFATRRGPGGAAEVSIDGPVDFDCVGAVELATVQRLELSGACPAAGAVTLAVAAMPAASVSFAADGVRIDYDSDGAADYSTDGCGAQSLVPCR